MSEEPLYQPNSVTAVLSRLETNVGMCVDSLGRLDSEFCSAHKRLHERLDAQDVDLQALKTQEAVRGRQVKWAVAIIAAVGWALNALISWRRET